MAGRSNRLPAGVEPPEWSPEKETLEHFERFAWTLIVPETGERLRLQSWQIDVLQDYFAGDSLNPTFFQHLWEVPSGNGKSGLLGALALHHATWVVPRPRVFVVGGVVDHARNTTNAVAGFVNESKARNGLLGAWWESQEINGGRVMPLWLDDPDVGIFARSAGRNVERQGGSSVEGKNPTLILVEEKHRHVDGGAAVNTLIAKTIKAGAVNRTVKVVTITTAGTDRNSALGQELAKVTDEKAGATVEKDRRPGEYYVRAIDAHRETVAHIWEVPEEISPPRDDADGKELDEFLQHVRRANPASWVTVKALRRVWRSMTRHGRWMFLRQNANMWVAAGLAAIDRGQWWRLRPRDARKRPLPVVIPAGPGIRVCVGLDRANKWDTTAIVPVWKPDPAWLSRNPGQSEKIRVAGAVILDSPGNGKRRRTSDVGDILETMRERWPDMVIVFDRNAGGGDVAEAFEEKHGLTIVDHGQGVDFDLASMRLGEYVEEGKLEHDGNEQLAQQVLAAVMKETAAGRRWRGEAPDDETRIDGFDALAMALNAATTLEDVDEGLDVDAFRIRRLEG